jgi:hypothetical protein
LGRDMWTDLRFVSTATIHMLRMRARLTDIMGRVGMPAGSLSARARGITDGAGRSIRASATIVARSAMDSLAAAMKDADLQDVVRSRASTVDRYAVAKFTAAVSTAVAAEDFTAVAEAGSTGAADAGKGNLNWVKEAGSDALPALLLLPSVAKFRGSHGQKADRGRP